MIAAIAGFRFENNILIYEFSECISLFHQVQTLYIAIFVNGLIPFCSLLVHELDCNVEKRTRLKFIR